MKTITKELAENWSEQEFKNLELGDERLNTRMKTLASNILKSPTAPINQAEADAYATKAAYRFYSNDKVSVEKIHEPHSEATKKRMESYDFLLSLQDTSFYNYNSHLATEGLGGIGQKSKGLIQHHSLIVTPEGLPLGVLSQNVWARVVETAAQKQLKPIEEKESYKWLEAMSESEARKPHHVKLVHVADRESDIAELYLHAKELGSYFLIRGNWDRNLCDEEMQLSDLYHALEEAGELAIEVPAKKGEYPSREAKLTIKFAKIELKTPDYLKKYKQIEDELEMWVVYAVEEDSSFEGKKVSWVLLTNVEVKNFEDALERISWYQKRWLIEVYHKTIKSGCQVEECRLGHADKLAKYIALNSIVAWRIMWMTYLSRLEPKESCTKILTPSEWKTLYIKIKRDKQLPKKAPTIKQAVKWIAQLGGYLARKSDPEPGVTSIWKGWLRLQDAVDLWSVIYEK